MVEDIYKPYRRQKVKIKKIYKTHTTQQKDN